VRTPAEQLILFLRLPKPLSFTVCADFADHAKLQNACNYRHFVVPAEGIEPPTFGLQNRCSTAELIRRSAALERNISRVRRSQGLKAAPSPI
jgi:hypothetical protein